MMIRVVIAVVFATILASRAHAQPSDAQREEIRQVLAQAREESAAGRHAAAAQSYHRALELMEAAGVERAPIARYNIGYELALVPGRELDAREMFRQFLVSSTPLSSDPEVQEYRREAQTRIVDLERRGSSAAQNRTSGAPQHNPVSPVGPILLGVAAAALLAGAIVGGIALEHGDDLDAACRDRRCPPGYEDEISELDALSASADGLLFGGAGIAAAGLLLTLLLRDSAEAQTPLSLDGTHVRFAW